MKYIMTENYMDMSRKAANLLSAQVTLKTDCILGLATGSTPLGLYRQLIERYQKGDLSFESVSTVNLDEYCGLPASHPQSYRKFMDTNLFDAIDIQKKNTHVPNGMAADLDEECAAYDAMIAALGGIDMQLLGIGNNGHIGFNEPDAEFIMNTHRVCLSENTRNANARFFQNDMSKVPEAALTMGMRHIMQAKKILLIACGHAKIAVLDRALNGPVTPMLPASILQLHPDLTVICSEE